MWLKNIQASNKKGTVCREHYSVVFIDTVRTKQGYEQTAPNVMVCNLKSSSFFLSSHVEQKGLNMQMLCMECVFDKA